MLTSGYAPESNCILNDASSYSYSLGTPGDADLTKLIPGHITYDATKLEFDVVAAADGTLTFSYVFGSEEYNEFVHTSYNDVFAFYIDGHNVALAGSIPVSIDDVNLGSNADLYVSNDGLLQGYPTPFATQYDGFTRLLTTQPFQVPLPPSPPAFPYKPTLGPAGPAGGPPAPPQSSSRRAPRRPRLPSRRRLVSSSETLASVLAAAFSPWRRRRAACCRPCKTGRGGSGVSRY